MSTGVGTWHTLSFWKFLGFLFFRKLRTAASDCRLRYSETNTGITPTGVAKAGCHFHAEVRTCIPSLAAYFSCLQHSKGPFQYSARRLQRHAATLPLLPRWQPECQGLPLPMRGSGQSPRAGSLEGARLQTAPAADASSTRLHHFFSNRSSSALRVPYLCCMPVPPGSKDIREDCRGSKGTPRFRGSARYDFPQRRLSESLPDMSHPSCPAALHHAAKERFLVAKSGVHAGTVDSHGFGQVGHGRAFVALLPEDPHSCDHIASLELVLDPSELRLTRPLCEHFLPSFLNFTGRKFL